MIALFATAVLVAAGVDHAPDGDRAVAAFRLDREPVTNGEFLAFLRTHPQWQRGHASALVAEAGYLASIDQQSPNAPVVDVSWFAAEAFCAAHGGRLPREAEWELAASAEPDDLDWYARPAPAKLPEIHRRAGIHDLHGLVWEWVEDFTSSLSASDCGGPGVATDPRAYARFLRAAFRGSLEARFGTKSLGFRCAYDDSPPPPAVRADDPSIYGLGIPGVDAGRGQPVVISMFYGSCPAACPALIDEISRITARVPGVHVVLVSFDPARDTPEQLRDLARAHHLDDGWTLISARESAARVLAGALGIRYRASTRGDFSHTAAIVALDAVGRPIARLAGLGDESPLVAALTAIARK